MKKILSFPAALFLIFVLSGIRTVEAAPTYGTEMPAKGRGYSGYTENTVFKHDLNDTYGNIKSVQHFYDVSYGVFDWLSLEGKAGLGDLFQKGGIHPKVDYGYGFAGGYGFRLKVLDDAKNRVKTVVGFHHISVHPPGQNTGGSKYQGIIDDWQVSLVASRAVGAVTPYFGGKFSRSDLIYKVNEIDRKCRPPLYYFGLVTGCTVKLPKEISVTVEGRFIDETALSAGVYVGF